MPAETRAGRLSALADQWEHTTQVILPDGVLMPVDHRFLVAQLRADPPDLARLNNLLTTLLAGHRDWPPARHNLKDAGVFSSILARPEFQWASPEPSPLQQWWRQLWQRFWRFIADLLPKNSIVVIDGSLLRYALTGLALLIFLTVLALVSRSLLASLVAEAEVGLDTAGGETLTADAALKRAQTLSSAGDYRTAVRYLYLSSLLLLEERGLLRYNRAQTNREYLRSVAHLPQLAVVLREVIDVFDRVWYGYQPLDEAAYAQYAAQVARLRQQK